MAQKRFQDNNQESNGSNEEFDDKFEDQKVKKKRIKEEVNQNLSNNSDQVDLNIDNEQKSDDKILSFGWKLRNDVISHVMELIALLDGMCLKVNDRKNLLTTNGDLIKRLSYLLFDDNTNEYKANLSLIDSDILEYLNQNKSGLFYELKNSTRKDMIDLLMQNTNFILMGYSNQNDLLLRNKNLINILINLKKSRFSVNSDVVKSDKIKDETQDQEAKDKENEATKIKVSKLEQEIHVLNSMIKKEIHALNSMIRKETGVLNSMIKEVTFDFDIKEVGNFLKEKKSLSSDLFCCSAVNWYLLAKFKSVNDEECLGIYLFLDDELNFDFSIKTYFSFVLIHPTDHQLNYVSKSFDGRIFKSCQQGGWGLNHLIKVKDLEKFIKHDKIKIRCNLKTDKIISW